MLTDEQFAKRIAEFLRNVDRRAPDECWPWVGKVYGKPGRGRPRIYWEQNKEKRQPTYRWGSHIAYWLEHRVWPAYVEHTCDNGICCNPSHLVDSDHPTNMRSMVERGRHGNQAKTECPQGHSYAEHGATRRRGNGSEFRVCNRCVLEDTWKRRGGPSARSQGKDPFPVCPKCGGEWAYYGTQGRRKCTPCANEKQRDRRVSK